jgi:diaminohydroxyphosphoribosylaminopyrimidine deaminase/5-amino-6-(5-phosphoribosylamino)uracil reductase
MDSFDAEAADRAFMGIALRAARSGRPSPNPHVGAVVVKDGAVVAVGHHEKAGLAHAEVDAFAKAGPAARGATLYVTLEPCNHRGRTGPCTDAVLAAGVARVVVGCHDPVHPGGAERLRAAGVEVEVGVREDEARAVVRDFTKHAATGLPFVTLKVAVTLDGRTATRSGDSRWVTGDEARRHAHVMRDRSDAVLVGIGTVLTDDPRLTVRALPGVDPVRVVLDPELRTPPAAKVIAGGSSAPAVLFHREGVRPPPGLEPRPGLQLVPVGRVEGGLDLEAVLRELGRRGIVRLLVEGGPRVHGAFLRTGLADRIAVFVAPRIAADPAALPLAAGAPLDLIHGAWELDDLTIERLGKDVLFEGALRRPEGP